MIQQTILSFLKEHHIARNARFLIAVSGGADSIALLYGYKNLNLNITALHCNFNLRGEESDTDEQFVRQFCHIHQIPLYTKHFDTSKYAKEKSMSIEMAARALRYTWFHEIKQQQQMDYIVIGHQADDIAETLFINLCRSTGIKGLSGIKPINGDILRPLLSCSRQEILDYLKANHIEYRNDSSNNSLDFTRNIIRHKIIPVFKEINPSFLTTILNNCQALYETELIYQYGIDILKKSVMQIRENETLIHIEKTINTPAPYTLLFELLRPYGFNKHQTADILRSHLALPGKKFASEEYILTRDRSHWIIYKRKEHSELPFYINNTIGNFHIGEHHLFFETLPYTSLHQIPADPHTAYFDFDKIKFPLQIRNWEKGDFFYPLGMHGCKKKLSDFFSNQKFSAKQKEECLLLLSKNKIVWIIGHRTDERFKISSTTRTLLKITIR
ncbi:tRNA lysidine(34) synthetase TilS [Odoribacter lunatus]|uniref:tRNA lysidine(34) synthetase TilS n=1 Tax=Odoribacter lunatus TaxID=2941335 RepID=UPI00203DE55B|nr:tRNA lysidine(34) synthetase TilS [Odoribacter lunatus]